MKLTFCVFCGSKDNLEHHHVLPKSIGGDDNEHNLITVCINHHNMIHNIKRKSNMRDLQSVGIKKAQKEGRYLNVGRKPVNHALTRKIKEMKLSGIMAMEIAQILNIGRSTVYKILK